MIGVYMNAASSTSAVSQCIFYYRNAYIIELCPACRVRLASRANTQDSSVSGLAELWDSKALEYDYSRMA